jgi:hypothetical protein
LLDAPAAIAGIVPEAPDKANNGVMLVALCR